MDLQEIKNLLAREKNVKIIIVENDKPVMIISGIENSEIQPRLNFSKQDSGFSKQDNEQEKIIQEPEHEKGLAEDIKQSTELIAKEEMPVDELRVDDLPF